MNEIKLEFAMPLLAAFAGAGNADDFCKHLVHKVMRGYDALGALIGLVGQDSKCHSIGKFGEWDLAPGGLLSLWSATPAAHSIKTGKCVQVSSLEHLKKEYPDADANLAGAKSYLYSPFESTSRAVGFLAFGFAHENRPADIEPAEIQMVSTAAEYISMSVRRVFPEDTRDSDKNAQKNVESTDLSNRQLVILQLMAEGKTNFQIGRNLNLSESTIKQESVRIFRKLHAPNRLEAADVARRAGLI